jgi:peptidoglycan/xylan/chitin deacetylase (PgdA/CDA1 family)
MILILTYHKILRGAEAEPKFYTVPVEQFERQIELIKETGFRFLEPRELVNGACARSAGSAYRGCVLTFDDGTVDHLEIVLPILARQNIAAVFFVPTAKLDRPGYLTTKSLSEFTRAGQTIGSHSHEHCRLDRLSEEDIRVQIERSRQLIGEAAGLEPLFFAPPGGFFSALVRKVALEQGIRAIRTMRWGYNRELDLSRLECVPVNRQTAEAEFKQILAGQMRRVGYFGKELAKKVLPAKLYETVRDRMMSIGRR